MQLNMQMDWWLAYLLHTLMHFSFSNLLDAPTVIFVGTVPAIFRSVANLGKGESIAWNSKYSENSLHFITRAKKSILFKPPPKLGLGKPVPLLACGHMHSAITLQSSSSKTTST